MKTVITLIIGMVIGFTVAKIGPHKIIAHTSKGIDTSAKMATKALDNVNKEIK